MFTANEIIVSRPVRTKQNSQHLLWEFIGHLQTIFNGLQFMRQMCNALVSIVLQVSKKFLFEIAGFLRGKGSCYSCKIISKTFSLCTEILRFNKNEIERNDGKKVTRQKNVQHMAHQPSGDNFFLSSCVMVVVLKTQSKIEVGTQMLYIFFFHWNRKVEKTNH